MRARASRLSSIGQAVKLRPVAPLYDFRSGIPAALASFTRSGLGTRIDASGKVAYGPHNLAARSTSHGYWDINTGITVVPDSAVAQDNTLTAATVTYDGSGSATYRMWLSAGSISIAGQATSVGVWLRSATTVNMMIGGNGVGGSNTAITVTSAWQRFQISGTGDGVGYAQVVLRNVNSTPWVIEVGNGQIENAAQLSPDIVTTTTARYLPRITYDPVTLASQGLLIEGQGTNLLGMTEAFDDAYWTKSATTITANTGTAPSGATTADTAAFASQFASVGRTVSGLGIGTVVTFSMWVQYLSGNTALHLNADEGGAAVTRTAFAATSDWQRITVTRTLTTGTATFSIQDRNGSGFGSVRIWGAQLETGSVPTSYIPNSGTGTAVRAADVFTLTGSAVTDLIGVGTERTIVMEFIAPASNVDARRVLCGNGNRRYLYSNTGVNDWYVWDGTNAITTGTILPGARAKAAVSFNATTMWASINGGGVVTGPHNGALLSPTELYLGHEAGIYQLNGPMASIRSVPTALTGSALQALSAL